MTYSVFGGYTQPHFACEFQGQTFPTSMQSLAQAFATMVLLGLLERPGQFQQLLLWAISPIV